MSNFSASDIPFPLRRDTFQLQCLDLGQLERVRIRHDNTGVGPGWYLEEVEVCEGKGVWHFPCRQWLDMEEGDGALVRELTVGEKKTEEEGEEGKKEKGQ